MRFFWEWLFFFFQKLAFKCACKIEELDKQEESRKTKKIDALLKKDKLSDKESKELDSLLDEEIILLK